MKKTAKTAVSAMAVCLGISLLAGCGGNSEEQGVSAAPSPGGASAAPASTGPKKEISVSIFDRGAVSAEEGSYESNRWTKWINENAPATVKWVPVPRNEAQTKLNTLIASGSAPDLIWEFDRNYIAQLANQGAIQPIDSYIEKYSTSYKKYLQEHPELKPYLTFDGKMYAVTSARDVGSIANHGMWIRQDWLDKLGLKMPTTQEEFLEVARKFKSGDPDGNGKADTVPIAFHGNSMSILRAVFGTQENQWYVENDKLQFGRISDRYRDSLAFQKQLFDEGLIDKEYITDKSFQRSQQFITTGQAGIYLASWNIESAYRDLKKNVPDAKLVPMEPFSTKYGKYGLYQEAPANILTAFNANMKESQIEAAVKFLDWMLDTGWKPLRNGVENVHVKYVNEVPKVIDADKLKKEVSYANEYAVVSQYTIKPEFYPIMAADDALSQEYAKLRSQSLETALKNKFRRDIAYSPSMTEYTQLLATFAPIAQQIEAKIITGSTTPDGGMEELRKEWKRLGGENVEKIVNEWYQKNKDQLK
ncbi:extracellular solute-binding protein [Paenibacillus sp. YN15]|uniref:extracellular solute-binding protein n=1 Tax=Paenibacillus sp. YN15 TaxID=1742774 RepID=UPI0037C870B9